MKKQEYSHKFDYLLSILDIFEPMWIAFSGVARILVRGEHFEGRPLVGPGAEPPSRAEPPEGRRIFENF